MDVLKNEKIHLSAPLIVNAKETLLELAKKHQIVFISNTLEIVRSVKAKRLYDDFQEINYCLHFTKNKDSVNWDIIIEDCPKNIIKLKGNKKVIISDHPYNRSISEHKNSYRIKNWSEINKQIDRLIF